MADSAKTNPGYIEPNADFIMRHFENTEFGSVKASELELLMFYMLAYHRGDLGKPTWELEKAYGVSQQKAARLKREVARRFAGQNAKEDMERLAKDIFENRTIPLDIENSKIGIPVYDPCVLGSLRESLAVHNLPYDTGNHGNLIRLSDWAFVAVFAKCGYGDVIRKNIGDAMKVWLRERGEFENLFKKGVPVSAALKGFLKENASDILKAVPVVGDFLSLSYNVGSKVIAKS